MDSKGVVQTSVLAVLCGALGAGAASRASQAQTSVITAQEFRVVDPKGTTRASLSGGEGFTELALNDWNGVRRVLVSVRPDGRAFAMFFDHRGNGGYEVAFETPSVNFADPQGRIIASVPWSAATMTPTNTLPPLLDLPPTGGRVAQSAASTEDVQTLQGRIDLLWDRVNKLIARVSGQQ